MNRVSTILVVLSRIPFFRISQKKGERAEFRVGRVFGLNVWELTQHDKVPRVSCNRDLVKDETSKKVEYG